MNTKNDNDGDEDCNTFDQHVSKLVFMHSTTCTENLGISKSQSQYICSKNVKYIISRLFDLSKRIDFFLKPFT